MKRYIQLFVIDMNMYANKIICRGDGMGNHSLIESKLLQIGKKVALDYESLDLHTFNDEMTISQVVRFFERNDYEFTKTMIQNYIRIGVLPPPVNKRYYTKNHLMLLSLIYRLKAVFSLDEIKAVFMPILKESDTFDDDLINTETLYKAYQSLQMKGLKQWEEYLPDKIAWTDEFIQGQNINSEEMDSVRAFMVVLTLMAKIATMKQLLDEITKEFLTRNS